VIASGRGAQPSLVARLQSREHATWWLLVIVAGAVASLFI
jgi:hypothetical protein